MTRQENRASERGLTVLFIGRPRTDVQAVFDSLDCNRVTVDIVTDGRQAIRRLTSGCEETTDARSPDLILLEFGFESPDGRTVLHAIKSSPRLGAVPVIVLTADELEAKTASAHGGNAHLTIPDSPVAYAELLRSVGKFWVDWARYPSESLFANTL